MIKHLSGPELIEEVVYLSHRALSSIYQAPNVCSLYYDLYQDAMEFIQAGYFKETRPELKTLLQRIGYMLSESILSANFCTDSLSSSELSGFILEQTALITGLSDVVALVPGINHHAEGKRLDSQVDKHRSGRVCSYPSVKSAQDLQRFLSALDAGEPCVVRGGCVFWESCSSWSGIDFWRRFQGRLVPVEVGTYLSGDFEQKFVDFFEFIQFISPQNDQTLTGDQIYLAQYDIFTRFPNLEDHVLPFPDFVHLMGSPAFRSIFIGPKGTVSPLHTDPYDNLVCQIVGTKQFVLFPPSESTSLYAINDRSISQTTLLPDDLTFLDGPTISQKYPRYESAMGFQVHLYSGDCLLIPRGWFHFVKSYSTAISLAHFFH